jgi:hypothetical protein
LSVSGTTTNGVVCINEKDEPSSISGQRFMSMEAGRFELRSWTAGMGEYEVVNGLRVPTAFEITWNLEDGDFNYFKGKVENLSYTFG